MITKEFDFDLRSEIPSKALDDLLNDRGTSYKIKLLWGDPRNSPLKDFRNSAYVGTEAISQYNLQFILWLLLSHNGLLARISCLTGVLMANFVRCLSLPKSEQMAYFVYGFVHDLGHLNTPDKLLERILCCQELEALNDQNVEHTLNGQFFARKLLHSGFSEFDKERISEVVLWHHEHYNGSGVPHGLVGKEIPTHTRLASICIDYATCFIRKTKDRSRYNEFSREIIFNELAKRANLYDEKLLALFQVHIV